MRTASRREVEGQFCCSLSIVDCVGLAIRENGGNQKGQRTDAENRKSD
jgi:hypothetical protein